MTRHAMRRRAFVPAETRLAGMLALAAIAFALHPATGHAQSVEQFYSGRQVKLFIGGGAGGGYDFYGRLIAPYLSKHLPGKPTVIAQGMPGAGGIIAANHLYNVAPRDGSVLGMFPGNIKAFRY